MKRIIDHYLQEWKQLDDHKSLLIRGARQVGKTYSVRNLGQSFEELVEINFEKNPEYADIFQPNLDPQRILRDLRLVTGKRIIPGHSLLFFDEIQQYPSIITALRYLYEEIPELHVVAAGSLLEFAQESVGISVGRVASLYMYPMSFLEYLVACDRKDMADYLLNTSFLPANKAVHDQLLSLTGEYLVIGGLPEVIRTWINSKELEQCSRTLDIIITAYRQDFAKYSKRQQIKYVDLLFNEVPALTGRKFKYSALPGTWKARELAPALELLRKASIVHKIYHSSGNNPPLKAESNPDRFKPLFFDIGLSQRILGADVTPWLLNPGTNINNSGTVAESFIGQELTAYSNPWTQANLYYWHREARSSNAEVDYLLPVDGRIIPVEVKAGTTGSMRSMKVFLQEKGVLYGIRFCGNPSSQHENLHSYAIYSAASLLNKQIPRSWI